MSDFREATASKPCPLCGGGNGCSVKNDGLHLCRRRQGEQPGWVDLGPCKKDGQWSQYRAEGDPHLSNRHTASNGTSTAKLATDWAAKAKYLAKALNDQRRQELADTLRLPAEAIDSMLIGWMDQPPGWTSPEVDADNEIVGISVRYLDGTKKMLTGDHRGLTVPDGWRDRKGPILLPEGLSDTLALTAMGLPAIGRPSNTGGADHLGKMLKDIPVARDIIVVAELDANANGAWPGRDGAMKVATDLAVTLGRVIKWGLPPDGKDARAWYQAREKPNGQTFLTEMKLHEVKPDAAGKDAKAPPTFETFDATDLLAVELPEPRFIIPDLLPEGLSILAGRPKLGKSWLALLFAIAVATGGSALGRQIPPGLVLYLALEDTRRRLQSRLKKLLNGEAMPQGLEFATQWPRMGNGGIKAMTEWAAQHQGARLIVVDTWGRFRPPRNGKSEAYSEDYGQAGELKAVADVAGLSILAVHHDRKAESGDWLDAISGTLGLTGAADGVMLLKRARGQHDAALHCTGRDMEKMELALTFDPQHCLWQALGNAEDYRRSRVVSAIIEVVKAMGGTAKPGEVADRMGGNRNTVKQQMWRMGNDGWLKANGDGSYSIPP